ncbi:hypothetical protein EDD86DRAFT_269337 [Gorgonomyces haynaldii]|nr:hypothetical protein EDD86DRAFT_269337 [Gorgonomyces haynaldii]
MAFTIGAVQHGVDLDFALSWFCVALPLGHLPGDHVLHSEVVVQVQLARPMLVHVDDDDKAVKTNETEKLVFLFQSVTDLASSGMPAAVVDWIEQQRLSVEQMLQTRGTGN